MQNLTLIQRLYLWACERLYAELAWSYDLVSWFVSFGAWSRWQATALTYMRGDQVLEIGFGTGTLLATLSQQRYNVIGLELSAAMHMQTTRKLTRQALNPPRVQAPTQQMPFATGSFDTIIATFPSGYIFDPATLAECARILRRSTTGPGATNLGGRLVIVTSVSHGHTPWPAIMHLLSWSPRRATGNGAGVRGTGENPAAPSDRDDRADARQAHFAAAGLQATDLMVRQGNSTVYLILAEHQPAARSQC